jgi:hypothetical protein
MQPCFQHPDRPAVEHCEICARPVCGFCLWYADSGERLCPAHAAEFEKEGKPVHPPERYAAGIAPSAASAARPTAQDVPYHGNSADVGALVAAVAGIAALASCAGMGWILPVLAVVFGLVSWLQAKDALNVRRTRWLAGIGMAGGGVFLLFFVSVFGLMFVCFFLQVVIASSVRTPPIPTAAPFATPIP